MGSFLEKLNRVCAAKKSLLCVGLDPDLSKMPTGDVYDFNRYIVDATIDLVCAYKPNLAFYESLGLDGLRDLWRTLEYIRSLPGDVLIIGDGKRGDIASSSAAYAVALFDRWGFDAATLNAYGGLDSIGPFLEYGDRGAFIWCRSSNQGAKDFQDLETVDELDSIPLYQRMAGAYQSWNPHGNIGLVVGATYPQDIKVLRELCPNLPFLIPGVGAQAGDLKDAVNAGVDREGRRAIINSSRGIIYASTGADFDQAARVKALKLRNDINIVLEERGNGWF